MKRKRSIFALGICMLNAGACAQNEVQEVQEVQEQLIMVGWAQAAGEIRIYARKSDLGKLYDGSCISGVMTGRRTMPSKLQNRLVSVYGRLIDAEEIYDMTLQGITVGVENYCNSSKIAIITRIVEEPVK